MGILVLLAILLGKSADLLEEGFVSISHRLQISSFITGFVVLSIVSSLPEMSVAVNSAIDGIPGLSVGHLVGATLIMITFVIGLSTLVHGSIPFRGSFSLGKLNLTLMILFEQVIALYDGNLTRAEGILLLISYVLFILYITKGATHLRRRKKAKQSNPTSLFVRSIAGIFGIILFSNLLVSTGEQLATVLAIPPSIVGLLILAVGTNTPELAVALRSNGAEEEKLATGNMLGSATVNTGVLGLLGIISPYTSPTAGSSPFLPGLFWLAVALLVFGFLARSDKELTRREGIFLLAIYTCFIILEGFFLLNS